MTNGQELSGKLFGVIHVGGEKSYDLATVRSLDVLSVPKPEKATEAKRYNETWELTIPTATGLSYEVVDPLFCFEYYSSSGYWIGGSYRTERSKSFYLKVGEQEHLANIEDFARLSLEGTGTAEPRLTVETRSGVKPSGSLVLKHKDDRGYHEATAWVLAARMASNDKIRVAVSKKGWTLTLKTQ